MRLWACVPATVTTVFLGAPGGGGPWGGGGVNCEVDVVLAVSYSTAVIRSAPRDLSASALTRSGV